MPYTRPYAGGFKDFPDTTTPINATTLNTMDVGIKTANDQFQTVTTAQRTALTPTVGQCVWDSDLRQLMVYMNASGGNAWQPIGNRIICTSTTRPATPFHGQVIYETDTKREWVYDGVRWVQTNSASTTSGVTGVNNLIVPPMCRLSATAATSAATSGTDVIPALASNDIDTDGMGTTGAAAKITINTTGVYHVTYSCTFAPVAGGQRYGGIAKNGVGTASGTTALGLCFVVAPSTANSAWVGNSILLDLVAGDYLQMTVMQNSGGALNAATTQNGSYLQAIWVGRKS